MLTGARGGGLLLGNYLIANQKNVTKFYLGTNKERTIKQVTQLNKTDPRERRNKLPRTTSHPSWQRTGILANPHNSLHPSWEADTINHRLHRGSERHSTLIAEKGRILKS